MQRRGFAASAHPAAAAEAAEEEGEDELSASLPPVALEELEEQGFYRDLVAPLYDMDRQQVGTVTLPGDVFDVPIRRDILQRVVRWQLARRQQGTHKTKTRSEVRGGGRKPRPPSAQYTQQPGGRPGPKSMANAPPRPSTHPTA